MRTATLSMAALGSLLLASPAFAAELNLQPAEAGSITVDATVFHLATPDLVNMSFSCEAKTPGTKSAVMSDFRGVMNDIIQTVSSGGRVRRNGTPALYQYYGPLAPLDSNGLPTGDVLYTGTLNATVMNVKSGEGQRIADAVEAMGCTISWDARLLYTTKYARQEHEELMEQLMERKEYFEELLGVSLTKVTNVYVTTSQDSGGYYGGYGITSSYDPESNTLPAMTSLSITYDIGTGTSKK